MEARGVIRGEYGPAILDSYGPERHGVGQRNCLYRSGTMTFECDQLALR